MISFLILSSTRPPLMLTVARPSSLYKPKFSFPNGVFHISAPPKLLIITLNDRFSLILTQVSSLLNSDFQVRLTVSSMFFIFNDDYGSRVTNDYIEKIFIWEHLHLCINHLRDTRSSSCSYMTVFFYRCINMLLIMGFDNVYILGTTVAHLDSILIKYFVREYLFRCREGVKA